MKAIVYSTVGGKSGMLVFLAAFCVYIIYNPPLHLIYDKLQLPSNHDDASSIYVPGTGK
jgi:hypothetical protein